MANEKTASEMLDAEINALIEQSNTCTKEMTAIELLQWFRETEPHIMNQLFGSRSFSEIICKWKSQDIVETIQAYEKEKPPKIYFGIGDWVRNRKTGETGQVFGIDNTQDINKTGCFFKNPAGENKVHCAWYHELERIEPCENISSATTDRTNKQHQPMSITVTEEKHDCTNCEYDKGDAICRFCVDKNKWSRKVHYMWACHFYIPDALNGTMCCFEHYKTEQEAIDTCKKYAKYGPTGYWKVTTVNDGSTIE